LVFVIWDLKRLDSLLLILDALGTVISLFLSLWWVYLPVLLYYIAYTAIQNYTQLKFKMGLKWILLEIKVPRENRKSPKAMEQIFAGLHGVYSRPLDWKDKFIGGKFPTWYSFELVGRGGETHFYIRTLQDLKNNVESNIYAQYPEAEIVEVPDYVNDLPLYLPDNKYDLWGTDFILTKEDAYPIRTYPEFEERGTGPDEVKRIDPVAALAELCSNIQGEEEIWIQILAAPTGTEWVKRGQAVLDRLMGKVPPPPKGNFLSDMVFSLDKAITNIGGPTEPAKEEKKERVELSPGKQELMKAIEKSWDKLGYQTTIRFLYIAPKDNFQQSRAAGVTGALRQFSSQNLNGFTVNKFILTFAKGLFKDSKLLKKKKIIYQYYRERNLFGMAVMRYVLNTEELATIYHFPDVGVRAPLLPKVEAKRGEPPVGLPKA
jgi:hypothetical protein